MDYIKVLGALAAKLPQCYPPCQTDGFPCVQEIKALYENSFIYCENGTNYKCDYIWENGDITITNRIEVTEQFVPVTLQASEAAEVGKSEDDGWTWPITIVKQGLTRSPNVPLVQFGIVGKTGFREYTAEAIQQAANEKLWDGRPVIVRDVEDHKAIKTGLSGGRHDLRTNEEAEAMCGVIQGTYAKTGSDGKLKLMGNLALSRGTKIGQQMREFLLTRAAESTGNSLYDLSLTCEHDSQLIDRNATYPIVRVTKFIQAISVDPVPIGNVSGAAILKAAESKSSPKSMKNKTRSLIFKLNAKNPKVIDPRILRAAEADDDAGESQDLNTYLAEAYLKENPELAAFVGSPEDLINSDKFEQLIQGWLEKKLGGGSSDAADNPDAGSDTAATQAAEAAHGKVIKSLKQELTALRIENRLNSTDLPLTKDQREFLKNDFKLHAAESVEEVDARIANFQKAGAAFSAPPTGVARLGEDEHDKLKKYVMASMFWGAHPKVIAQAKEMLGYDPSSNSLTSGRFKSFQKMINTIYPGADILEDMSPSGFINPKTTRAAESYSSPINTELVLDALHMRALAFWRTDYLDDYKKFTTAKDLPDFRPFHDINIGVVDSTDSQTVNYTSDFTETALSGKEETQASIQGRGGLFTITYPQIVNDVIGEIAKAPEKLFQGIKFGLYSNVMNTLKTAHTTVWAGDGLGYNVVDATRGNQLAPGASLSPGSLVQARNLLLKLAQLGTSAFPMGLKAKYLIGRTDDFVNLYKTTTPAAGQANNVATADQTLGFERIEVPTWNNGNTEERWFLMADPMELECLNIGYLQGRQEPELVSELPLAAVSFTQMAFRYRWHFPYVVYFNNPRGIAGSIVS